MKPPTPHFLLYSETRPKAPWRGEEESAEASSTAGYWRFVLQSEDGSVALDISDGEGTSSEERLNLLAIVRGLEALPAPSRVTVVTRCGWIRRGLRSGLEQWRESHWQWERFGHMAPIKDADLWQRVDRALQFHEVECRSLRVDPPRDDLSGPHVRHGQGQQRAAEAGVAAGEVRRTGVRTQAPPTAHLLLRVLRRLFGWCGLCRNLSAPVMVAH